MDAISYRNNKLLFDKEIYAKEIEMPEVREDKFTLEHTVYGGEVHKIIQRNYQMYEGRPGYSFLRKTGKDPLLVNSYRRIIYSLLCVVTDSLNYPSAAIGKQVFPDQLQTTY